MIRILIIIATLSLCTKTLVADSFNVDSLIQKAEINYFDLQDFNKALALYKSIESNIEEQHAVYPYVVEKVASSMYFIQQKAMEAGKRDESIYWAQQFLDYLIHHEKKLQNTILVHKYYMLRNLVVDHFALGDVDAAKDYQDILYQGHKNNELPSGLKKHYNFEQFEWKGNRIVAYEAYKTPESVPADESFVKHMYYVYSSDKKAADQEPSYTLETSKIVKQAATGSNAVYVLSMHVQGADRSQATPLWTHTFAKDVDYSELREAVLAVVDENSSSRRDRR